MSPRASGPAGHQIEDTLRADAVPFPYEGHEVHRVRRAIKEYDPVQSRSGYNPDNHTAAVACGLHR